jgi:hypothetical protein
MRVIPIGDCGNPAPLNGSDGRTVTIPLRTGPLALALAFLAFLPVPAPARADQGPVDALTGRWGEAVSGGGLPGGAAIEIETCGEGERLCGRIVGNDGSCGPVVLEARPDLDGQVTGTYALVPETTDPTPDSTVDDWRRTVRLRRTDAELGIEVLPSVMETMLTRSVVLPRIARYRRLGAPACAALS